MRKADLGLHRSGCKSWVTVRPRGALLLCCRCRKRQHLHGNDSKKQLPACSTKVGVEPGMSMIISTGRWVLFNALAENHSNGMLVMIYMCPHPVYNLLMNKMT